MKNLWNRISAALAGGNVVDTIKSSILPAMIEPLEDRSLLSAPRVASVYADNRGLMTIKFDQKMAANTISAKSVKIWKATSGADAAITNASIKYTASKRILTINAKTSADTVFKVKLLSKLIKNTAGAKLDGEFKGAGKSGNGRAGGDYFAMTRITAEGTDPVARFTTDLGNMDVVLFRTVNPTLSENRATPITVENFLGYANAGDWDGTVFHRVIGDFVNQGGGFEVDGANRFARIHNGAPTITNEPKNSARPANPGNLRGTIAMARQDDQNPNTHEDENSATDEWYFNDKDNVGLDTSNTGFTVFGQVAGDLSDPNNPNLKVMDKINKAPIADLDSTQTVDNAGTTIRQALAKFFNPGLQPIFTDFPFKGSPVVETFSPKLHSVIVTRLAINAGVVKGASVTT